MKIIKAIKNIEENTSKLCRFKTTQNYELLKNLNIIFGIQ